MRCFYGLVSRHLPRLARCGLVLVGLSWAVGAHAQAQPWTLVPKAVPTSTGYQLGYSGTGQAVQTIARAGAVAANDAIAIGETVSLSTPAGQAAVTLTRTMGGAAMRSALVDAGIGLARGGLVGAAAVAAGALLAPVADKFMQDMGYTKDGSGGWTVPSSVPPVTVPSGNWTALGMYAGSFGVLLDKVYAIYPYSVGGRCDGYSGDPTAPYDGMQYCQYVWKTSNGVGQIKYADKFVATYYTAPKNVCPDGSTAPASGECVGPPVPVDPSKAKQKAATSPTPPSVADWAPVVDAMGELGYAPPPDEGVTVSGTSRVDGTPVVSTETLTDAAGQAQTVTTTKTPHVYLDYAGDQVSFRTEVSTTTTNPDGSTKTTTNSVGSNTSDNPCFGLGSILGCTQLGTPEAASVPTTTKQITYSAEDVSLPSGCPAPVSMGRFGSLSFQPACDSAGYMRPLILAGAAISALLICVYAVAGVKT